MIVQHFCLRLLKTIYVNKLRPKEVRMFHFVPLLKQLSLSKICFCKMHFTHLDVEKNHQNNE